MTQTVQAQPRAEAGVTTGVVLDWIVKLTMPVVVGVMSYFAAEIIAFKVAISSLERTTVTHQQLFTAVAEHDSRVHEGAVTREELDRVLDKQWTRFSERQDILFKQLEKQIVEVKAEVRDNRANK